MKLAKDWSRVLCHAWSVRLLIIAGVLSGIEAALPLLSGVLPVPAGVLSLVTLIVVAAAFVARIVAQKEFENE